MPATSANASVPSRKREEPPNRTGEPAATSRDRAREGRAKARRRGHPPDVRPSARGTSKQRADGRATGGRSMHRPSPAATRRSTRDAEPAPTPAPSIAVRSTERPKSGRLKGGIAGIPGAAPACTHGCRRCPGSCFSRVFRPRAMGLGREATTAPMAREVLSRVGADRNCGACRLYGGGPRPEVNLRIDIDVNWGGGRFSRRGIGPGRRVPPWTDIAFSLSPRSFRRDGRHRARRPR